MDDTQWRSTVDERIDQLIEVLDGPERRRLDGSTTRERDLGLVAVVANLTAKVEALTVTSSQPSRVALSPAVTTILVALIAAIATLGAAAIGVLAELR